MTWQALPWIEAHPFEVHAAAWILAFSAAVLLYQASRGEVRFVLALGSGALLAHLGWGLLHFKEAIDNWQWLLAPGAASVLFVPFGVLLLAPWKESLAPLPIALAVARLGCLPFDCCYREPTHALVEIVCLIGIYALVRMRADLTVVLVCSGLGALRLLVEPLRSPTPVLSVEPSVIAVALILLGPIFQWRLGDA